MAHLSLMAPQRRQHKRSALSGCVLGAAALCVCWSFLHPSASSAFALKRHEPEHDEDFGSKLSSLVADNAGLLAVLTAVLCAHLAKEESTQPAPASVPIEKRPDYYRVCVMSVLLCGLSGMVNAVAIIEMAGTVAHQTGNTSHFGRLLGMDGARFGALLLAFTVGAGVAGYNKADGEALFQGRYCPCMMSSAVGTAVGVLLQWASGRANWVTLPLWAFAQGIQNGVTSRFTSMPLRTTHHTGTLTDAGAGIGLWLRALVRGEPLPSMHKTALLLICLFGYAGGGVAAKLGTDAWGIWAAMPPAAAMAALALGYFPIAPPPQKAV